MKRLLLSFPFIFISTMFGCGEAKIDKEIYRSETLIINQISKSVYQHTSFFDYGYYGKASGNGMIVVNSTEALVFDTAADDETSSELIDWIEKSLKCRIKAVIPTHYHVDNLGGLNEFHKRGIPSYANNKTIQIAKGMGCPVPQHGFEESLELAVGKEKVFIGFFGEGHTCDNIIGYYAPDDIMFGGCLIKEDGAGKGNLEESNVEGWGDTVRKIKEKYPGVKIVIPGHGKTGGKELLDYTIGLFDGAETP